MKLSLFPTEDTLCIIKKIAFTKTLSAKMELHGAKLYKLI